MRAIRPLLLALAVASAGCERSAGLPPLLFPVNRLVESPAGDPGAHLLWGRYVKIDGEDRLTLTSFATTGARLVPASPPTAGGSTREWSVRIPDDLRHEPFLVRSPLLGTGEAAGMVVPESTGPVLHLRGPEATAIAKPLVQLVPLPSLPARDIVTEPLLVPPGAVLSLGLGFETLPFGVGQPPVEFRVAAIEDERETTLYRTKLVPEPRRWVDARVDLAPVAGRTVRLRLSTNLVDPSRPGTALPVWADPVVLAPRPAHALNVLLVSLDTLRARSVSAYGAARATMPNLDELIGAAGTIFDEAWTTAPHTLPSHMSVFTSLYLRTHGITAPSLRLPAETHTLPEQLRAAGYDTGAITEDGFIIPRVGFERGFSTYRENTSPNRQKPVGWAADTFREGIEWLAKRRDRPTFLFLHTYQVHFPYDPQPPYDRSLEAPSPFWSDAERDLLRYEQSARYLDDELAALLAALGDLGLATRTLVVVMADHGEEFMEHGRRMHGFHLYEESTRVPLMLRCPGVVPAGLRVRTPVSLVDVAPTILDLVGAPPLVGAEGKSLVPLLLEGKTELGDRTTVFSECASALTSGIDTLALRTGDLHCIYRTSAGASECFDRTTDPDERTPLPGSDPRIEPLRAEAVAFWGLRRPAAAAPSQAPEPDPADAERTEKLRALGYVR